MINRESIKEIDNKVAYLRELLQKRDFYLSEQLNWAEMVSLATELIKEIDAEYESLSDDEKSDELKKLLLERKQYLELVQEYGNRYREVSLELGLIDVEERQLQVELIDLIDSHRRVDLRFSEISKAMKEIEKISKKFLKVENVSEYVLVENAEGRKKKIHKSLASEYRQLCDEKRKIKKEKEGLEEDIYKKSKRVHIIEEVNEDSSEVIASSEVCDASFIKVDEDYYDNMSIHEKIAFLEERIEMIKKASGRKCLVEYNGVKFLIPRVYKGDFNNCKGQIKKLREELLRSEECASLVPVGNTSLVVASQKSTLPAIIPDRVTTLVPYEKKETSLVPIDKKEVVIEEKGKVVPVVLEYSSDSDDERHYEIDEGKRTFVDVADKVVSDDSDVSIEVTDDSFDDDIEDSDSMRIVEVKKPKNKNNIIQTIKKNAKRIVAAVLAATALLTSMFLFGRKKDKPQVDATSPAIIQKADEDKHEDDDFYVIAAGENDKDTTVPPVNQENDDDRDSYENTGDTYQIIDDDEVLPGQSTSSDTATTDDVSYVYTDNKEIKLGQTFTLRSDSPIYTNMYDATNMNNGSVAYFDSSRAHVVKGVSVLYDGVLHFIKLGDNDADGLLNDLIGMGGEITSVLASYEGNDGYEGFYNINDVSLEASIGGYRR